MEITTGARRMFIVRDAKLRLVRILSFSLSGPAFFPRGLRFCNWPPIALGTGSARQVGTCRTIVWFMAIPHEPRPLFAMMHSFAEYSVVDFTYKETPRSLPHLRPPEVPRVTFTLAIPAL